jgi:23S rRNA C2498 (ribose-2'-O)-methylase RlmM
MCPILKGFRDRAVSLYRRTCHVLTRVAKCIMLTVVFSKIYCNGFGEGVARQQLCKHGPSCNNIKEAVFSVDPTDTPTDWLNCDYVMCPFHGSIRVTEFVHGSCE